MSSEYLVKFPPFKECLDSKLTCKQFFFVMEQFAEINAWTEEQLISITAQCALLDIKNVVSAFPSYELLKVYLQSNSEPSMTFKERDLLKQSLVQCEDETVIEFYQRCEEVHAKIGNEDLVNQLLEQDILMSFIAGL